MFLRVKRVNVMPDHVLVVEDNDGIRTTMRQLLEFEGYAVETAANGVQALEAIERNTPAVMLLDMRMPVLDGWGVARALHEQGRRVRTIVVTAAENARRWCAEITADGCVGKPFDMDVLLTEVQRVRST
jgi:two-component system chemotaxis response regulator CheY